VCFPSHHNYARDLIQEQFNTVKARYDATALPKGKTTTPDLAKHSESAHWDANIEETDFFLTQLTHNQKTS
jgi:hypothetical protein